MTKSEIIKAAEEVIEHFEYEAKFIEETFDMVDTELVDKHRSRARAIHALIALVPKDEDVSDKDFNPCVCGEHEYIYVKLLYLGSGKYDGWVIECNRCGYSVFHGLDRYLKGNEAMPFLIIAWNRAMLKAAKG